MFPILYTLTLNPLLAQRLAIGFTILLSAYLFYDGWTTHGRAKLIQTLAQTVGFLALGVFLALSFLTPERFPPSFTIDIRSWGVMTVIGMYSCFAIQRHFGRKMGLSTDQILTIWVYGGLCAVAGARALHVLVNWKDYRAAPITALYFWDGGLAFIGAAVIAALFAYLFLRRQGHGLVALDALVLGVALTHGLGRIGCFLAGCCYGQATDLPIGVSFAPGSIAQYSQWRAGLIPLTASTAHLHPTQLYEAGLCFLIGLFLLRTYRKGVRPGALLASYFLLYPLARFFVELLRDDPEREFLFRAPQAVPMILSTTQTSALLIVPLAGYALWRLNKAPAQGPAPTSGPVVDQAAASPTSSVTGF